jgi:methylmalonyl-CoA/ethylmalonyl-CoA epimerase
MIKKIDHLGIAVKSLEEAVPYYEKALGLKCEHREEVASQKVRTAFFNCGEVHLELLEPTDPESPIAKFLEKNPSGGIHHIAFGTDDVQGTIETGGGRGRETDSRQAVCWRRRQARRLPASEIHLWRADRVLHAQTGPRRL